MSSPPSELVGQEVACRTFGRILLEWEKKGLPLQQLVEGSGCSTAQLRDKNGRISWASYCAIIANTRAVWDDEGFIELGLIVMDSPWARPFTVPARLLYSAKDFYHAMVRPGTGVGIARRMFACIQFRLDEHGPHHLSMETTMVEGYPLCREFFLITKGSLISLPAAVGLDTSKVEMEAIDGGFRYDIRLPGGGGLLAGFRRTLTWPFTARAAARELEQAYIDLHSSHLHLKAEVAQRERIEQERKRLIADLEVKNVELENRNAELERFTYTVSHDLKSPLVTIKGFLGLLQQDLADGDEDGITRDIEHISRAADKMGRLLAELLELSRIGRSMNPPEDVDLTALVPEAVELVAGAIAERGVTVAIHPSMPQAHGDRVRLLEVYTNLLDNAVKFMGDQAEPRIEIGAEQNDRGILCFVKDNGIGVEPEYQEKVFGLFNRLHPDVEGTGIGLALVRRIVEVHGGRVWLESEGTGAGSTVLFQIPAPPTTSPGVA